MPLRILLVAEGSGGHVIPALEVSTRLAQRGALVELWYAQRSQTSRLLEELSGEIKDIPLNVKAIPMGPRTLLGKLKCANWLWTFSQQYFKTHTPHVVIGFGGWVSAPALLAARNHRFIRTMLHEQNVQMGKANRFLSRFVDRVALSFQETQQFCPGLSTVITGMPIRQRITRPRESADAERFGLRQDLPTLLILGGSQGSRAINQLLLRALRSCSAEEQRTWQFIHITGSSDEHEIKQAYRDLHIKAWVSPFLTDMAAAYAQADIVVGRAGASTIAELACCAKPSILIPYPYAGGHQRANARLIENAGGALVIEESFASARRLLLAIRWLIQEPLLRNQMGQSIHRLSRLDATDQLVEAVLSLGQKEGSMLQPGEYPSLKDRTVLQVNVEKAVTIGVSTP